MLKDDTAPAPRRRLRGRSAFTLAEVLLALALGAIVLGLVSAIGAKLQHQMAGEANRLAANEQLSAAAELLPLELRGLSSAAGDLFEARDTSIQFRSTVGSALVCGGSATTILLAPFLGPRGRSIAPAGTSGDTLWLLADSDSGESWRPLRVGALRRVTAACGALTDTTGTRIFDVAHLWAADLRDSTAPVVGAIVRITRPQRLSFYRSGDGRWYLGMRSWNTGSAQWNPVQPMSGPYAPPTRRDGARFEYFDASNALVPLGTGTRGIARIEVRLVGEAPGLEAGTAVDSERVVVAIRNR